MRESLIVLAIIGGIGYGGAEGHKAWMRSIEVHGRCPVCDKLFAKYQGQELCISEVCYKGFPSDVERDHDTDLCQPLKRDDQPATVYRTAVEPPKVPLDVDFSMDGEDGRRPTSPGRRHSLRYW